MPIADILLHNAEAIQDDFDNLISNFQQMGNDQRMSLSQTLFENLRAFFQGQNVLIDEAAKTSPAIRQQFIPYDQAHQDLLDMYQRLVFIHVDEPGEEYKARLETMRDTFKSLWEKEYQTFICGLQADLDADTETTVIRNVRKLGSV